MGSSLLPPRRARTHSGRRADYARPDHWHPTPVRAQTPAASVNGKKRSPTRHTYMPGEIAPGTHIREALMETADRSPEQHRPGFATVALWRLAGVSVPVMSRSECMTDWGRHARMGAAALATAVLSGVAAGWAAWTVFESADVASVFAVGWGLMVLNLDGLILSKSTKRSDTTFVQQLFYALPRLFFAVLIALAMSEPLKIQVFRGPIDAEIAREHQERSIAARDRIDRRYPEIQEAETRITALRKVLAAKEAAVQEAYREAAGEADGTRGSRIRNTGRIYEVKNARFLELSAELDALRRASAAETNTLQARIAELRTAREAQLAEYEGTLARANDLLVRLVALYRLGEDPETGHFVQAAAWLLTLLLGSIELTPVLMKLFGTRGPYDAVLQHVEDTTVAREDRLREEKVRGASQQAEEELAVRDAVQTAKNEVMIDALKETLDGGAGIHLRRELAATLEPVFRDGLFAMAAKLAAEAEPDPRFAAYIVDIRRRATERAAREAERDARTRASVQAVADEVTHALHIHPSQEVNGTRRAVQ